MGTSAQGTGWPGELVPALVSPPSGSLAGIFAPFEQPGHALKLLPGPRGGQFPAALRGVVHDVTPRLGGLSEPSLPFQQEGAGIDRAEILGVTLARAAPVGERAVRIAL